MSTTAPVLQSLAAALADGSVRVVDLSQPLHEKTPVLKLPPPFANTPGLTRHEISRYDDRGPAWAWSWLEVGEHVGTHFDAPIHWITGRDGEDVASVPPERLVGPAVVIDKSAEAAADPDYLLTVDDVRAFEAEHGALPAGGWLLLRTGWDARANDEEARALDPRDRALAKQLAFGTVQRRLTLDHVIAERTKGRLEPGVRAALQLGLFQLLFLDRVAEHAAIAEAVELAKPSPGHRVVNAVLRRVQREGVVLPEDTTLRGAAIHHSHPEWLVGPAGMRAGCVRGVVGDGRAFDGEQRFDGVLRDPPCSGLGTLRSHPD